MPQAVTHILVPILVVALLRDHYIKKRDRKKFPLHYVLAAGIGGVLPDFDFIISLVLAFFGVDNWNVHKTFSHSLFFPLVLLFLAFVFSLMHKNARVCNLGKHKLKLGIIFLMLSFGVMTHIILDALLGEMAYFFYPLSFQYYVINLFLCESDYFY